MPPGRQRKFELIPTTLVKSNGPRPPMTSKAAKKAYQKANQGPKVSRAEQRRLEREELERQRKEYEKERASDKARAAREKKALKAEAERTERKKLGIPEPNRFVRASQPTISRFVKGNGKRVWQEIDGGAEESEGTANDDDLQNGLESPVKESVTRDEQLDARVLSSASDRLLKRDGEPLAKRATIQSAPNSDSELEDDVGYLPSLSPTPLLDEKRGSFDFLEEEPILSPIPEPRDAVTQPKGSPQLPRNRVWDKLVTDSQELAELANTQLLSEAAEAEFHSDHPEPSVADSSIRQEKGQILQSPKQPEIEDSVDKPNEEAYPSRDLLPPPALLNKSFNMPPPPLRHVTKNRHSLHSSKAAHARITSQSNGVRIPKLLNLPPPSTQAFLEDNLNEFLLSPSQELRELLSDDEDLPPNPIPAEPGTARLQDERNTCAGDNSLDFDTFICTQDLVLSSQDLEEISPEKNCPNRPTPKVANILKDRVSESFWDCFPSTQDLTLSAQDLEEIETPSRAPRSASNNVQSETRRILMETTGTIIRKPQQSVTRENSARNSSQTSRSRRPLEEKVNYQSKTHPRPQRRFFEEKEEDLYQAALHESKLMAQKPKQKKIPLKSEGAVNVGAGIEIRREKRTLQRTQSAATDYGDDEFAGFSEQELAALF